MPLRFSCVCELLDRLETSETRNDALPAVDRQRRHDDSIKNWFKEHSLMLHSDDISKPALLSTLLPEQRADRKYHMQEVRLMSVLGRTLGFGSSRLQMLRAWDSSCKEDFGLWVAKIVKESEAGLVNSATVEEIDDALTTIAATSRASSPEIRRRATGLIKRHPEDILRPLVTRMPAREMKWFVRVILKRMHPVMLNERLVMWCIDPILPTLWSIQANYSNAMGLLTHIRARTQPLPSVDQIPDIHSLVRDCKPKTGVKVGRPQFLKARSIEHCLRLVGSSCYSVEPKLDGEYCQVHVDLSKGDKSLTIFSKSGKDSTDDKQDLHRFIKQSLRFDNRGSRDCRFSSRCILEGEMVVFDTRSKDILEFNKIRKHVTRSGSFIGIDSESQIYPHEQLGIVFYDALLIDEEALLFMPQDYRRKRLRQILDYYPGQVQIGDWGIIDFSLYATRPGRAREKLERTFSKAMARKCEGLVLKPSQSAYLPTGPRSPRVPNPSFIKLKADYIPGLGDCMDFALVGASFDGREALSRNSSKPRWTNFLVACFLNKNESIRFDARPRYKAVGTISSAQQCISRQNVDEICRRGQFNQMEYIENSSRADFNLELSASCVAPHVLFQNPFVVELLGSGFDKPAWESYFMLRHPRITKIHSDRGIEDIASFDELQDSAHQAMIVPENIKMAEREHMQRLRFISQPKRRKFVDCHSPFSQRASETTKSTNTSPELPNPHKICAPPFVRVDRCEMDLGTNAFVSSDPMTDENGSLGNGHSRGQSPGSTSHSHRKPSSTSPSAQLGKKRKKVPLDAGNLRDKRFKRSREDAYTRGDGKSRRRECGGTASRHGQAALLSKRKRPLTDIIANGANRTPPTPGSNKKVKSSNPNATIHKNPGFTRPLRERPQTPRAQQNTGRIAQSLPSSQSIEHNPAMDSQSSLLNLKSPSELSDLEEEPSESQISRDLADLEEYINNDALSTGSASPSRTIPHGSPFFRHIFYLSPCVASMLWVKEDLLSIFQPDNWTATLINWQREILPDADPLGPVVGESQSEPGMQKAVLVEPRRPKEMKETVDEIMKLTLANDELVQVFDWRLLDKLEALASEVTAIRGGSDMPGPHKAEALAHGVLSNKGYLDPPLWQGTIQGCFADALIGVVRQGEKDAEGVRGLNVFERASHDYKRRVGGQMMNAWLYDI